VGVIIRFRARKLGAPMNILMGIKLVTTYNAAKILILEIWIVDNELLETFSFMFNPLLSSLTASLHTPVSFGE